MISAVTGKKIYGALKSRKNDKTPGNDKLSKEFHEVFYDNIKTPLDAFIEEEIGTSQKHAVIKLIGKRQR